MKLVTHDTLVTVGEDGELVLTFYAWLWSAASWRANGPFRTLAEAERYGATSRRSYAIERRFSAGPLSPGLAQMLAHPTLWLRHPVIRPPAAADAAQSPAQRFAGRRARSLA